MWSACHFSVKYKNGFPILADSLKVQMGCYEDSHGGTYVYFKQDTTPIKDLTATGSLFSPTSIGLGAVVGLAVGAALTALLIFSIRRRKESQMA